MPAREDRGGSGLYLATTAMKAPDCYSETDVYCLNPSIKTRNGSCVSAVELESVAISED